MADLLSRWTNGLYKSTTELSINGTSVDRSFDPNPETYINPAISDPITCGDYLIWRFGKAFSYRK